jgi:hypothetical protein
MPVSAWIMSILVAIILYGGLALCIRVAVRKTRENEGKGE